MLISFEGIDGCGKTTQIKLVNKLLQENGYDTLLTREPGGTEYGERIRNLLFSGDFDIIENKSSFMLALLTARGAHVKQVIRPAMRKNKIVLCDRFELSTYAYQCGVFKLSAKDITYIHNFVTKEDEKGGGLYSDIIVYFQVKENEIEEIAARGKKDNVLDDATKISKLSLIRAYEKYAQLPRFKVLTISATLPIETQTEMIYRILSESILYRRRNIE